MCAKKFLSTPSARRATIISSIIVLPLSISIHALREEGDIVHGIGESLSFISIHALREEGDIAATARETIHGDFYPRPPRGGRPTSGPYPTLQPGISIHALREEGDICQLGYQNAQLVFLSTPSARRATHQSGNLSARLPISIHALREEGDEPGFCSHRHHTDFYPRPPRGGRRTNQAICQLGYQFLSTPSARRATRDRDPEVVDSVFLSTPSARRATSFLVSAAVCFGISIHALREEGDTVLFRICAVLCNFYPRPPRGGRRFTHHKFLSAFRFLSTPSARRATLRFLLMVGRQKNFYPRPPRGGRPAQCRWAAVQWRISIHALREEGDADALAARVDTLEFLSTPSARRATAGEVIDHAEKAFLSTPSARRATA